MLVGKIKNHRNVFRNLIISYLLILLIPFCIGSFVYLEAVKLVKEDALKNNEKILTQTKDILDIRLNEVEAISKQLSMSPKVNSLMNMKQFREGTPDYYKVWDLLNTMPKYNLTNQFINDIYLVYKNTKLVVSLNTPYASSTSFYRQIFSGSFESYGQFWSMLWEKSYQREYVVMKDNGIYSFQTIPIDAVNNLRGVIMVSISGQSIMDMLSKVDIGNQGIVFIYDNKGQIIAEIRGKDVKVTTNDIMAGRTHNGTFKSKSGRSFFIYKAISGSNDWTYVSVVPEEIVLSKVAYIKQVTGFVTLVTLLIGAVAAGYFSYRNSTPIKRLMNKVAVLLRGSTEHPFNENDDLESSITKLIQSNESLREKMSDQLPLIKMSLFRRLLNGEFADENEINALLSHVNVHLENKKLAVILLKLQRKINYLDRHELQNLDFVKLIAQDILEQSAKTECYAYEVDQTNTAFILSFDEKLSKNDCRRMIGDLARVLCDKLYRDYHTKAVVSCGDIYKGIRNIATSFDEAKQAMEYAIINEPGGLIRYDEIPKDTEKWFFPFELEMRLISLIKSGEKEGVYAVIDDIYKENMERRNLSPAMLKQLLLLMKCSAVRAFGQSAEEQTVGNYPDLADEHANVEDLFTGMKEMYLQICDKVSSYKERSNQHFCKRLMDYVTQHYMDENLTIHTVSEHFNSTKSYIYQFFKDHMGMTFTDYLEQLRIQQACRLMQETDLTIKDIAQQTGYNSDHSFRRAFKRVMGLVPTEYAKATREVQM